MLRSVDSSDGLPPCLMVLTDSADYEPTFEALTDDYWVVNADKVDAVQDDDLGDLVRQVTSVQWLCLPDDWWTSNVLNQLVIVAGWLGVGFVNPAGVVLPTVGGKR